jgi:hypothetical protein
VAVVILAVALGVAVVVAVAAVLWSRALAGQLSEARTHLEAAEAKVAAGLERETALEERHEVVAAERAVLEASVQDLEGERARLQAAVDDGSGELARLDDQLVALHGEMAVLRDDLANAQEAAREADGAAVAAVAQADAANAELVAARAEVETAKAELAELRAAPQPAAGDRPEAAPVLVEGLWSLERSRTERTWRQSVSLDPAEPGPFAGGGDPARVAVEVEAAAVREDVGSVIEVDWQIEGTVDAGAGLLLVRSAQELLARASRTVEEGVLVIARDGDQLVLSLLGPGREPLDLDGALVHLPLE